LTTLKKLGIPEEYLKPFTENLVGFSGEQVNVKGYIKLLTIFGLASLLKIVNVKYLVVHCQTPYNALLGRPSLNSLGVVVSTPHLAIKFLMSITEVGVVHADQKEA